MTAARFRVGVIGMGRIAVGFDEPAGPAIRTHLKGILADPRFELACVADIDQGRARAELERFGVKADIAAPEALAVADLDVLCIASPDDTHLDLAQRAASGRSRVVLVEKPLGGTQAQQKVLVERFAARGAELSIDHTRRWIPKVANWIAEAKSGAFGPPVSGVVHYSRGLRHNGIHAFDLIGAFFGTAVSNVKTIAPAIDDYASSDPTHSLVVTVNAAERHIPVVMLGVDGRIQSEFSVDLRFEQARVHIFDQDGIRADLYRPADSGFSGFAPELRPVEAFHDDPRRLFGILWNNIADHLDGKASLASAGVDGLVGYELMDCVVRQVSP
ncbi:MAG: Gfo/Idh/MocA family oxidoreductase [Pseudolabrys sp.]|nr:Gfo/Idh/MocA family oxidoreductase [Pseudolabrys sp.]